MKQYISKDTLVAEIERKLKELSKHNKQQLQSDIVEQMVYNEMISFINTIEVKDVDYERELSKYVSNGIHRFFPNVDDDYCKMDSVIWQDYVIETANHFFELGLSAQKGE